MPFISGVRVLLGLFYLIGAVNGLPPIFGREPFIKSVVLSERAYRLITAMMETGYLYPLLKITELVGAILLLTNKFVPLALTFLAPISLNIFGIHLFRDRKSLGNGIFIGLLHTILAYAYRENFKDVLEMTPSKPPSLQG